jgi:hypothetical protein
MWGLILGRRLPDRRPKRPLCPELVSSGLSDLTVSEQWGIEPFHYLALSELASLLHIKPRASRWPLAPRSPWASILPTFQA